MRRTDFQPTVQNRRLTGVGQSARKSMANARRSNAPGTGNVRYSLMGRNSLCPSTSKKTGGKTRTVKDPRELQGNKQRQKEVVADIVEFCNEHEHDITVKEMMSYSTSVYKEVFFKLAGMVHGPRWSGLDGQGSWQECLVKTMEQLEYPFRLQKSSFVNLSMSSFPIAIGVLDWLIHFINCSNSEEIEEVEERKDILANAFKGKLAGRMDVAEDVEKIYAEQLEKDFNPEQIEEEYRGLRGQFEELEGRRVQMTNLEQHLGTVAKEENTAEKHKAFRQKELSYFTNVNHERESNQEKLQAAISSLKMENKRLSDEIGDKDTARDLQERRKKEEGTLRKLQEEKSSFQMQSDGLDIPIRRHRGELSEAVTSYNQFVTEEIRQLDISISAKLIQEANSASDNRLQEKIDQIDKLVKGEKATTHKNTTRMRMDCSDLKYKTDGIRQECEDLKRDFEETQQLANDEMKKREGKLAKAKTDLGNWKSRIAKAQQKTESLNKDIRETDAAISANNEHLAQNDFGQFNENIEKIEGKVMDQVVKTLESTQVSMENGSKRVSDDLLADQHMLKEELERELAAQKRLDQQIKKYKH